MKYLRSIPVDLFKEAYLLTSLGKLCQLINDRRLPLYLNHRQPHDGFYIEISEKGDFLYCANLIVRDSKSERIEVRLPVKSKDQNQLVFTDRDGTNQPVFDVDDELTSVFLRRIDALKFGA